MCVSSCMAIIYINMCTTKYELQFLFTVNHCALHAIPLKGPSIFFKLEICFLQKAPYTDTFMKSVEGKSYYKANINNKVL